jgi:hypothetical protein
MEEEQSRMEIRSVDESMVVLERTSQKLNLYIFVCVLRLVSILQDVSSTIFFHCVGFTKQKMKDRMCV